MTDPNADVNRRRHVVGFIFGSIVVGVVGLVTAILLTVTGILNTFDDVSASYEDVFDRGVEVGPDSISVDLEDARYMVLTFSDSPQQPSAAEQAGACSVTNEHGDEVGVETSTQEVSTTEAKTADAMLAGANYVTYTSFEATRGTYDGTCQQLGLLTDGGQYSMGGTAMSGVLIGVGAMVIAAVLFVIGLLNHSRNRKAQRSNPRPWIDYRLEDF